jgi:hypothetical protein
VTWFVKAILAAYACTVDACKAKEVGGQMKITI